MAGVNYLFKVRADDDEILHVKICKPLPHTNQPPFVLQATGWKDANAIKSRIESSLDSVGLNNKGFQKPHQLSGGERQRVAIARALLNTPMLIIADEPTGNLDPQMSLEITELLYQISLSGTAVLMASHDYIAMQQFKGKVWVCEEGKIQMGVSKA